MRGLKRPGGTEWTRGTKGAEGTKGAGGTKGSGGTEGLGKNYNLLWHWAENYGILLENNSLFASALHQV